MPGKLSERLEEQLRDHLETTITPSAIHGYNPDQTWGVDSPPADALWIVTDWSDRGSVYPKIVVTEREGPQIPGGGSTNVNGKQGDGSGNNQYAVHNITLSCQAVEGESYLDDTPPDDLVQDLYSEVHSTLQDTRQSALEGVMWVGTPTPPTYTANQEETSAGSTITFWQSQGTVPVGVLNTPG